MYVAADLCKHIHSGAQKTVMTLGAGQGKTLVYLLVALILSRDARTKNNFNTFTILTSSELLAKQLNEIIRKHDIKLDLQVLSQPDFVDFRKPALYIINDSD